MKKLRYWVGFKNNYGDIVYEHVSYSTKESATIRKRFIMHCGYTGVFIKKRMHGIISGITT